MFEVISFLIVRLYVIAILLSHSSNYTKKTYSTSNWHFVEVCQAVFVFLHCFQYLLDGIASQDYEVDQKERPEDINLHHFEVGADQSHN